MDWVLKLAATLGMLVGAGVGLVVLGMLGHWLTFMLKSRSVRGILKQAELTDSLDMRGLVAIEGVVVAEEQLESKLAQVGCVAYRSQLWELDDDGPFKLVVSQTDALRFFVRTERGMVRVQPGTPQLVLSHDNRLSLPDKINKRIRRLLRDNGINKNLEPADLLTPKEHAVRDGDAVVVVGRACDASSSDLPELGPAPSYRQPPQGVCIEPVTSLGGVVIADGTHKELMTQLGSDSFRDFDAGC